MSNSKEKISDITDFVTASDSEFSELSDDDDDNEIDVPQNVLVSTDEVSSDEDSNIKTANRVYQWRKHDTPVADRTFQGTFTKPPEEELTPLHYFKLFFKDEIFNTIVENTNLYSVQKSGTSVHTNKDEISSFIGIHILMGIVQLPNYKAYWSRELRFPPVLDVMPINRYEKLRQYLHSVDNNAPNNDNDKLFKVRPIITAIRDECVKVEPEEFQVVDEQIISCKTKRSKTRQYNPKKPKKWGFKNLVCAGSSGMMYDFDIFCGKDNIDPEFQGLQKCSAVVAKLTKHLHSQPWHKLYFDNWFTALELFHYLMSKKICAVGTFRANRLHGWLSHVI